MTNLLDVFKKNHAKKSVPPLRSGAVVRVHEKIREGKKERIQIFEGVIIGIHGGSGLDATFTVRKVSFGVGVEKIFPLHMPNIIKIETIKNIRNRQSKLYYLRKITDKQIQRRSELSTYAVWKDDKAQAEEDELKAKKEAEAKAKEDAKKAEQAELDKKFAEAEAAKATEKKAEDTKEAKGDKKDDEKNETAGK